MRNLLIISLIFLSACKRSDPKPLHTVSHKESAQNKLHGVWESIHISSKSKSPPQKVSITFTTYNDTKLIYMQLKTTGAANQKFDQTIRVALEEKDGKNFIIPAIKNEIENSENNKNFEKYDPKHIEIVKNLAWAYSLSDDRLTIEMDGSTILLRRVK